MAAMAKDLRSIVRAAEEQGWEVKRTKKCHLQFRGPEGGCLHTGTTPSEHRALANLISAMRRHGFIWKGR